MIYGVSYLISLLIMLLLIKPNLHQANLNKGDIIAFRGWGNTGYKSFHAQTLSGNRLIVKFQANVKVKSEFFNILTPVKERS